MAAALLGSLFTTAGLRANADEFTVGHTGADVAFSQYGLTGKGVTVAVLDSGISLSAAILTPAIKAVRHASAPRQLRAGRQHRRSMRPRHACRRDRCRQRTLLPRALSATARSTALPERQSRQRAGAGHARGRALSARSSPGIQWCVTNKAKYNIQVMNLSLGHPVGESYTTDPLCQAVEAAWKAGIVVVCAAGNDGRLQHVQCPRTRPTKAGARPMAPSSRRATIPTSLPSER